MTTRFFDTNFDFHSYLNERLMEIGDENEKNALKEIVRETLIPFYHHTEEAYLELERRLLQSKNDTSGRFEVFIGLMDRNKVDITDESFFPMQYRDIHKKVVEIEPLKEHLRKHQPYTVMQVFLQMDATMIDQIKKEHRVFKGVICTETEEYSALFQVRQNRAYLEQISDLYQVFVDNGIQWNTICAPYLFKFFDVTVIRTDCPFDDEIIEMEVDFDEYQEYVKYDCIPMWNVKMINESSGAYPSFVKNAVRYEHCIYRERLKQNCDYLVKKNDTKIWNVFHLDGDIHIICDSDKPQKWELLEFNYGASNKKNDFPVFGNHKNNREIPRLIHTYGELRRYIKEMGYEEYLELTDILPVERYPEREGHTYSMDWFLEDEIRNAAYRPIMVFQFMPAEQGNYLNEDIMSYLVSKIQWQLPEYVCVGELVNF